MMTFSGSFGCLIHRSGGSSSRFRILEAMRMSPNGILYRYGVMNIKSLLIVFLLLSTLILACVCLTKYASVRPACLATAFTSLQNTQNEIANSSHLRHAFVKPVQWDVDNRKLAAAANDRNGSTHAEGTDAENGDGYHLGRDKIIFVDNVTAIHRRFKAFGSASSVFVHFGAYRGGDNSFVVVGLGSKPLHVYSDVTYMCEWEPANTHRPRSKAQAEKFFPDWGYGRVYTVVVVNCTFSEGVGLDGKGGKLILHAISAGIDMTTFTALKETNESFVASSSIYRQESYKYDFMYCGSSLFGDINPQRIREWLAYHTRLMGPRSHFVFHDAGGVSQGVRKVLLAWQALGYVTLHDIREQAKFDGYYYNQFLVVNDCLHRTRFLAKWTFFFDVDEYLYIPPHTTLLRTMESFANYTQITFQQSPMSSKLCQSTQNTSSRKTWAFEKLVFLNVKRGIRWDRKYAIQARNVLATGVHLSENLIGKTLHTKESAIKYYHYHNTITRRDEDLCKEVVNSSSTRLTTYSDKDPFRLDFGMQYFAQEVKKFELHQIGPQPFFT
ncbi:hypothetical protein KP509_31G026200 [Ceratopteris richardii]|uniref:Glycosyltransferase family 92 protein n=1 Tax=Ceratopteris richardii TaxID=49495 RepID=A0A8T2QWE9_CERRI|nr:hypothetical protein KP509_31G026200 [Ceratopteris richardii]